LEPHLAMNNMNNLPSINKILKRTHDKSVCFTRVCARPEVLRGVPMHGRPEKGGPGTAREARKSRPGSPKNWSHKPPRIACPLPEEFWPNMPRPRHRIRKWLAQNLGAYELKEAAVIRTPPVSRNASLIASDSGRGNLSWALFRSPRGSPAHRDTRTLRETVEPGLLGKIMRDC
jgi:hypothetical protein